MKWIHGHGILSGPDDIRWKGIGLRAQAGLGTYVVQHDPSVHQATEPYYWLLRASGINYFKRIVLMGSVSARGWDYIAPVSWSLVFGCLLYVDEGNRYRRQTRRRQTHYFGVLDLN